MQTKIINCLIISIFILCSEPDGHAQIKSIVKDQVKITEINRSIGDIRVIITQYKRLDHKGPLCHAMIRL